MTTFATIAASDSIKAGLARIAESHGFTQTWHGQRQANVKALLQAIADGELVTVKREEWRRLMECSQREEAEEATYISSLNPHE